MNGSIQEKSGKFYIVLNYKDENGKYKYKWINTGLPVRGNKKKAEGMLRQILNEEAVGNTQSDQTQSQNILFTDYVADWLRRKKEKVQLSTWEGYEIYATKHIIPYFEPLQLKINEITPKHIKDYYETRLHCERNDHKQSGLSPASIRKHALVLNMVFEEAMLDELIERNPASVVPTPVQEKQESKGVFLTVEQANKMLEAFRGHELQPIVYVTLYYGLRKSEVLGLKWDAIDFENNTLRIQHTVVKNRTIVAKDTTKSVASRRTYPLLPEIKDLFLKIKQEQTLHKVEFGSSYINSDYVFVWQDGQQYRPDSLTRSFQRVLVNHGLPKMRFHDIRHSTASILYDKGWGLKDIQEWLGHASVETTSDIYTHISKVRRENVGKDLDKTFKL